MIVQFRAPTESAAANKTAELNTSNAGTLIHVTSAPESSSAASWAKEMNAAERPLIRPRRWGGVWPWRSAAAATVTAPTPQPRTNEAARAVDSFRNPAKARRAAPAVAMPRRTRASGSRKRVKSRLPAAAPPTVPTPINALIAASAMHSRRAACKQSLQFRGVVQRRSQLLDRYRLRHLNNRVRCVMHKMSRPK